MLAPLNSLRSDSSGAATRFRGDLCLMVVVQRWGWVFSFNFAATSWCHCNKPTCPNILKYTSYHVPVTKYPFPTRSAQTVPGRAAAFVGTSF